jgi:hypothetical protein
VGQGVARAELLYPGEDAMQRDHLADDPNVVLSRTLTKSSRDGPDWLDAYETQVLRNRFGVEVGEDEVVGPRCLYQFEC